MNVFRLRWIVLALALTVVTGFAANGPITGTAHLKELVPGVTIPDITPSYNPGDLPGFFQDMGEAGRAAYITINNFDFLLIICYSLFAVIAFGTMLQYFSGNKVQTRLALLGVIPGLFDAIESLSLRVIVLNPYDNHSVLSQVAAFATNLKFMAINLALFGLLVLLSLTLLAWIKRRDT